MATLEELVVQLSAETASLRAEMQTAQKVVADSTEKMQKSIDEFSKNSTKQTNFFQTAMATMTGFLASEAVTGALGLVRDGLKAVTEELIAGGKEAIEDEQAFNLLARSLAINGKYSEEAANGLISYADELEEVLGISGAVIAKNMALVSSLTGLDANGIKLVQQSAADMSVALGKDLGTATEAVTKAINGNEGALGKLGIRLDLTTDKTKNLEIVTKALNDKFGGAAQNQINTFGGAINFLSKNYGDMFKELARTVTQNEVVIAVMREVGKIFKQVAEFISENAVTIRDDLGQAIIYVIGLAQDITIGFKIFFQLLNAGFQAIMIPIRNVIDGFQLLKSVATGDWDGVKQNAKDIVENYTKVGDAISNIGGDNAVFDTITDGLGRIKSGAKAAFEEMQGQPIKAAQEQKNLDVAISNSTGQLSEQQKQIKDWAMELAKAYNDINTLYATQTETLKLNLDAQNISQTEYFAALSELQAEQFINENEQLADALSQKLITQEQYLAAVAQLENKYAADSKKLEIEKNKAKEQNFASTMDVIAGLASSSSKELAAIGKAAAIYNATIDGYAAVQKALASAPPPFNFGLAALVGAATAQNVAKIAGTGLAGGIDSVPRSARGGNAGDNFSANLMPGERVVPTDTNKDLKNFLDNQQGGQNLSISITVLPGTGMNNEQIGNLVEQIRDFTKATGFGFT